MLRELNLVGHAWWHDEFAQLHVRIIELLGINYLVDQLDDVDRLHVKINKVDAMNLLDIII